ncbi:MAG: RNA polymerase subunit sigma-24 [Acidobacteriota bacterium]
MHDMLRHLIRRGALVLAISLALVPAVARADEVLRAELAGRQMSAADAAELEAQLRQEPNHLASHIRLANYYMGQPTAEARSARTTHVLWIIRHHPASRAAGNPAFQLLPGIDGKAYDQARDAWLEQTETHGNDAQVLGNAAKFFLISDRERAKQLLLRAKSLEPASSEWPRQLGHLYQLDLMGAPKGSRPATARQALHELETSLIGAAAADRWANLVNVAKAAFEAGEHDKARSYANELLADAPGQEQSWNYGNAIHHGNLILGRLALLSGDTPRASDYLLAAGRTPGSPQLNSFGPNMILAKELLEAGEQAAVLQYFELCGNFWTLHSGRLEAWAESIADGEAPIFGANLAY